MPDGAWVPIARSLTPLCFSSKGIAGAVWNVGTLSLLMRLALSEFPGGGRRQHRLALQTMQPQSTHASFA